MRFVIFTHSLVSDWNHGNAHFLRGVVTELMARGHAVDVFEPEDSWSRANLLRQEGEQTLADFARAYPHLRSTRYAGAAPPLDDVLRGADVVLVHEWSSPELVREVGRHHARHHGYRLFFHDTHHRAVTEPEAMAAYDLRHYDGVLAFGKVIRDIYLLRGWARQAWVWHEAADARLFSPRPATEPAGDLVWIGNWGDEERSQELREFLIGPVKALGLRARVHGVRYPDSALEELARANIEYGGWLPNHRVPETFARYRVTIHVPRRPYATALPGIPTIRPFEALACGIPLVSAPWQDAENLFRPGTDFLVARNGGEMTAQLHSLLCGSPAARDLRNSLIAAGRETIVKRHTCSHRVEQLLALVAGETD